MCWIYSMKIHVSTKYTTNFAFLSLNLEIIVVLITEHIQRLCLLAANIELFIDSKQDIFYKRRRTYEKEL